MNDEPQHKHRKYWLLGILAVFIGILGIVLPNDNIGFEFVKNNTNLAPTIDADHPGTGERLTGVTYWANDSTLFVMAFAHANTTSQTAQVALFVDGVLLLPQSGRPLGGAEEANRSVSGFVPKGSNYTYVFSNYHHYEIREWKVLSGRNGTLSTNITNITNIISSGGGGVSFNGSPVDLNGTNLFNGTISNYTTLDYLNTSLNNKVNKSGDNITGILDVNISTGYITSLLGLDINATKLSNYTYKNNLSSYLSATGIQVWELHGIDSFGNPRYGYISYSFPGGFPGIIFFNGTQGSRINIYMNGANGLRLTASPTNASSGTGLNILTTGNISIDVLSGAAGLVYVDDNGILQKVTAPTGAGNIYTCWNKSTKQPFYGTPGC